MRWLVTAGATLVPIDQVRAIGSGFTGRTGARVAAEALRRGHRVTLLTSNPDTAGEGCEVRAYRTFDDLRQLMGRLISEGAYDCVVHSAAVSDYGAAGVFAPAPGTAFDPRAFTWAGDPPRLLDRAAAKVNSDEPELWLRLARNPKLVDLVRRQWGFRGVLVKFKLEVDVGAAELLEIAEQSRRQSEADLMVANTLAGSREWAYVGPLGSEYRRVGRVELPAVLADAVEALHRGRGHG